MFKINDYIMYGTTGVCKIIDITRENIIDNNLRDYYVLSPIYNKNTIIKTPVDNQKVNMRKVLNRDDVSLLINNITKNNFEWIEDEMERVLKFKSMIKSGNCEELIKIIRSVYFNKEYKKLIGNKVTKRDQDIMGIAENMINEEFTTALGILPEEVFSYIENHM